MSEGKSIAELMDTFYADGYDATTPGNHDWSYGADKLRTMTGYSPTGTPFAMLCANAKSTSGVWSSSITKTLDRTWEDSEDHSTFDYKIKVGVVGAMDESLESSLRADLVAGTSFSSAANAINAEAKRLRETEGCNVVVCIAHTLNAKTFAAKLVGVDALIAGHEHINLDENVTGLTASRSASSKRAAPLPRWGCFPFRTSTTRMAPRRPTMTRSRSLQTAVTRSSTPPRTSTTFGRPRQGLRLPKPP